MTLYGDLHLWSEPLESTKSSPVTVPLEKEQNEQITQ